MKKTLIVITGPTGTGKTSLGIEVSKHINGAIISADSRQVYKGIDFVTNKLSPYSSQERIEKHVGYWVQDGVLIYSYDVISPDQDYNVTEFISYSLNVIHRLWGEGKVPIIVGGTGFYIDALLGYAPYSTVGPNELLRETLRKKTCSQLQEILQTIDKQHFLSLSDSDSNNPQRLIRYIEIASEVGSVATGLTYSPLRDETKVRVGEWVLHSDYPQLYHRCDEWVQSLIESKVIISETEYLIREFPRSRILNGLIFRTVVGHLSSGSSTVSMQQTIMGELHTYIRQQVHWLRRRPHRKGFDVSIPRDRKAMVDDICKWYDT